MSNKHDVIVIGGGGAGLTAALYTARADLKTVIFEKGVTGGQISKTHLVENFPGFPDGISGSDISMKMEEQATKHGAEVKYETVVSVEKKESSFYVQTEQDKYEARSVVLAMGAVARRLGVSGEEEFTGRGVSYCATCDAPFFRGRTVAVVGGGDAAVQEALFLTKFAEKVYLIHRRDELRAGHILRERALANEKISFEWNSLVEKIDGAQTVRKLELKDVNTGKIRELEVDGVFVFIGHDPASDLVKSFVELDEFGYVKTDSKFGASISGVYAAGEIRSGAVWQLITSCGEGCVAALGVEEYIDSI